MLLRIHRPRRIRLPQFSPDQSLFLLPSTQCASLLPHVTIRSLRSIDRKVEPNKYNYPYIAASPQKALERKANTQLRRPGVLAIKKGMTATFDSETGKRRPCTVLQLDRVQVIAHKTVEKHGYFAVQIGAGLRQPKNVTKPMLGHFAASEVSPKRHVAEFQVRDQTSLPSIGQSLKPSWFRVGQFVDTKSDCKGKGFAGGMKRHGFSGQPASHGASLVHRAMGSAGQSQGGGSRVYPGKRMAGRMGGQQVTVRNSEVVMVDDEKGIIVIAGCVSGPNKGLVRIQDAMKKPPPVQDPANSLKSNGESASQV